VQVKGRKSEFMIYELLGFKDSANPELELRRNDQKLNDMTWAASSRFELQEFTEAATRYREILRSFPSDPVSKLLLRECSVGSEPTAGAE